MKSAVNKKTHALDYDTKMSDKDRDFLITVCRDEIKNLEKLLGWDCSSWLATQSSHFNML